MRLHVKRSGDRLLRCFGVVGILTIWMVVGAFCISAIRPHIIHLLRRTLVSFTQFKGTTPWGFISSDLVQPILLLIFFVVLLHRSHGGEAVKIHWQREGIIGLKALGLLVIFWYLPLFLLRGVSEVYADHIALVGANQMLQSSSQRELQRLRDENTKLNAALEDRKRNVHTEDPAYEHIKVLYSSFIAFRRAIGDQTPCEIKITSPVDASSSDPIIRQVADVAAFASGCGTFGPGDARMDPDVEKEAVTGMKNGFIIVHTKRDQAGSLAFYDAIAPYLSLVRRYDDLPAPVQRGASATPTLIWLQFGKDVHWIR